MRQSRGRLVCEKDYLHTTESRIWKLLPKEGSPPFLVKIKLKLGPIVPFLNVSPNVMLIEDTANLRNQLGWGEAMHKPKGECFQHKPK
jgi:hypothetical protein